MRFSVYLGATRFEITNSIMDIVKLHNDQAQFKQITLSSMLYNIVSFCLQTNMKDYGEIINGDRYIMGVLMRIDSSLVGGMFLLE
ncbi:hypothetical protein [Shimazuella kribbensis]|uniref:hypothetical protein n=1 Tax=Shimazuella kribbensis TaxID=139808 RepID=UPI000414B97E|nr:hypothetical protein [Shimazuella kribbensis]